MRIYLSIAKIVILAAFVLSGSIAYGQLRVGAECIKDYLPMLKGKSVALVVNQTSMVGNTHLLDTLLALKVDVKKVFAPEHGFRGDHSAGATVKNGKDEKTGLPLVSLYGSNKKPTPEQLKDVDIIIFDIQDVGVRFYTYISTLHYIMESAAENNKSVLVLDRPNPNGHYIDGPTLEPEFKSFVGMHPVPLVHGMTVGEYAMMINGEGWLKDGQKCSLKVIPVEGYTHDYMYRLPIAPSPNLPTIESIYLYPSLGLFEGTDVSVGRGTDHPFEVIGRPGFPVGQYSFTPRSIAGKAENPPYLGEQCEGFKLTNFATEYILPAKQMYLFWLIGFYDKSTNKEKYFTPFFDKLAGTDKLRKQVIAGKGPDDMRATWQADLEKFKPIRAKYLLYQDFTSY